MQVLLLDEDSTPPQLNRLKEARPNKINFLNNQKNDVETKEHVTNYGSKLRVEKGSKVVAGEKLTE